MYIKFVLIWITGIYILYMGTFAPILDKLQKLQFRAIRICLNVLARTHRQELTYRAQLPLLEHRRIAHLRNFMYKRKSKPENQLNIQGRTRMHDATLVRTIRANSRAFERSVFYRGAKDGLVWFGLLGFNASATARVISRR